MLKRIVIIFLVFLFIGCASERLLTETKKKFNSLDAAHKKFFADATSLYNTTDAELKARLEDIVK